MTSCEKLIAKLLVSSTKNEISIVLYIRNFMWIYMAFTPEEAVEYLERILLENDKETKPVYAITGTGHHSKNGKDKVGKAIRNFLNEWRYAYREFSVPGDRNNVGGILGIDARSWDKTLSREGVPAAPAEKEEVDILSQGHEIGDGKIKLLVRDAPKGPRGR